MRLSTRQHFLLLLFKAYQVPSPEFMHWIKKQKEMQLIKLFSMILKHNWACFSYAKNIQSTIGTNACLFEYSKRFSWKFGSRPPGHAPCNGYAFATKKGYEMCYRESP